MKTRLNGDTSVGGQSTSVNPRTVWQSQATPDESASMGRMPALVGVEAQIVREVLSLKLSHFQREERRHMVENSQLFSNKHSLDLLCPHPEGV